MTTPSPCSPRHIVPLSAMLGLVSTLCVIAEAPQISNVHPDFPGRHLRPIERGKDFFHNHHVVTGENLDAPGSEFWVWSPSGDREKAIQSPGFRPPPLPAQPPTGAKRIQPLDLEKQVAVIDLGKANVLWVKSGDGFSEPYLFNVAKPFWIQSDTAWPGKSLAIYGFGLGGYVSSDAPTLVALVGKNGTKTLPAEGQARSPRHKDAMLINFRVPADLAKGEYEVYVHSGFGGEYGWRPAGTLTVVAEPVEGPMFNVRDYGAKGDGVSDDLKAIESAIAAASKAGGGRVVFPPGTYPVKSTLRVPERVALIGAGREQSVLLGRYSPVELRFRGWWAPTDVAASVLAMESHTRLEQMGVRGAVANGFGGYGMVTVASSSDSLAEEVVIRDCLINAPEEDLESGHYLYRAAIVVPGSRRISIIENDIHGSLEMRPGTWRSDIINNTFRRGTALDLCSLIVNGADNLIDSNRLVDTPGRLVLMASSHTYVRYNEMHDIGRGGWTNVPEPFLLHGAVSKSMGQPTAAAEDSLTDDHQDWEVNQYAGATVLITAGRGFGQYRMVRGNSKNSLALQKPWRVMPDKSSEYSVGFFFTENALFNNQNHSPGVLSLWLDCIGNLIEKHRDDNGRGMSIWGQDRSAVKADGTGSNLHRFSPSWYNMITDNWLDGSFIEMVPGVSASNAWRGVPLFANIITHNKIRHPHTSRSPNTAHDTVVGGLQINGGEGRIGASHNLLLGNLITNTPVGIVIQGNAFKTFVIGNVLHDVAAPLVDHGIGTIIRKNEVETPGAEGLVRSQLPDATGKPSGLPEWQPPKLAEVFAPRHPPGTAASEWLRKKLGARAFERSRDANADKQKEAANLKAIYQHLSRYEKENGSLPQAAFYPLKNRDPLPGLESLLGEQARPLLTRNAAIPLDPLAYVWNPALGGKKFGQISHPSETWVLMDTVVVHGFLLKKDSAGEEGGVNVLFADGSVRWLKAEDAEKLLRF